MLIEFEVPYSCLGRSSSLPPPEPDKWVVPPQVPGDSAWRDREDLRELIICSIHPPGEFASRTLMVLTHRVIGCQDIDDALHARPLPNGNIEAGVREYH